MAIGDVPSWMVVAALVVLVPYLYVIARVASIAFFQTKREHHRQLLREFSPETTLEPERRA